jgi:hypothetical protein
MLAQPPYCSPCHQWRSKKYHQQGACRRCGRVWLVNADGLCRPCVGEIQKSDAACYFNPAPEPRRVQLVFILPEVRLPPRMPFGSYRARSDGRFHPPPWARAQLPAKVLDDPRFCPPVMAGQLPLFETRRTLTVADARKVRDRVLAGWDQAEPVLAEPVLAEPVLAEPVLAEPVLAADAAEHEYGQWWQLIVTSVLRLALAVREADGKPLADDAVLDVLPRFAGTAAEILRHADHRLSRPGASVLSQLAARFTLPSSRQMKISGLEVAASAKPGLHLPEELQPALTVRQLGAQRRIGRVEQVPLLEPAMQGGWSAGSGPSSDRPRAAPRCPGRCRRAAADAPG